MNVGERFPGKAKVDGVNVRKLVDSAPIEQLLEVLAGLATSSHKSATEKLKEFLTYRCSDTFLKHTLPRLTCIALLHRGPAGVQALVDVLPIAQGFIYPNSILEALWLASKGKVPSILDAPKLMAKWKIGSRLTKETVHAAEIAFRDLAAESMVNKDIFDHLLSFMYQGNLRCQLNGESTESFRDALIDIFADGAIKITRRLMSEFCSLVSQDLAEERYQSFLKKHPEFLDPLASGVISKQKLGVELVTDFVIRRHDDKYVLVEIEKPNDRG